MINYANLNNIQVKRKEIYFDPVNFAKFSRNSSLQVKGMNVGNFYDTDFKYSDFSSNSFETSSSVMPLNKSGYVNEIIIIDKNKLSTFKRNRIKKVAKAARREISTPPVVGIKMSSLIDVSSHRVSNKNKGNQETIKEDTSVVSDQILESYFKLPEVKSKKNIIYNAPSSISTTSSSKYDNSEDFDDYLFDDDDDNPYYMPPVNLPPLKPRFLKRVRDFIQDMLLYI